MNHIWFDCSDHLRWRVRSECKYEINITLPKYSLQPSQLFKTESLIQFFIFYILSVTDDRTRTHIPSNFFFSFSSNNLIFTPIPKIDGKEINRFLGNFANDLFWMPCYNKMSKEKFNKAILVVQIKKGVCLDFRISSFNQCTTHCELLMRMFRY